MIKQELVTILKTFLIVTGAVLVANAIERKYLKSKVAIPMDATPTE
jgi:hypothetical protein